jgi:hypothetical protein
MFRVMQPKLACVVCEYRVTVETTINNDAIP